MFLFGFFSLFVVVVVVVVGVVVVRICASVYVGEVCCCVVCWLYCCVLLFCVIVFFHTLLLPCAHTCTYRRHTQHAQNTHMYPHTHSDKHEPHGREVNSLLPQTPSEKEAFEAGKGASSLCVLSRGNHPTKAYTHPLHTQ